jgi:Zn-dependent protease/CBS domain-containing protein
MRLLRFIIGLIILAAAVAGVVVALSRNPQSVTLDLSSVTIQDSLGALIAGAVVLGALVVAILLLPGRLALGWQNQGLRSDAQRLEGELEALRQQYRQLQTANQNLQRARQQGNGEELPPAASPRQEVPAVAAAHWSDPSGDHGRPSDSSRPSQLTVVGSTSTAARSAPPLPGSFRIGRIAGISIDIHVSWLIIVVLLTASLATSFFPQIAPHYSAGVYWIVGLVATLLLFLSVLLHELGHSLVARARGLPVSSITLFIFGGVSNLEQEPHSPGEEFVVAFIGPVISLILGGLSLAIAAPIGQGALLVKAIFVYLGTTNLLLGIFNLLPGFPLDGGRVLRSILWKITGNLQRATQWAARVGQVLAFLFILAGVWLFFLGDLLGGIWIGFIGWFLLTAAQSAGSQAMIESLLGGVTVAQAMTPAPPAITPETTVQTLVDEHLWPQGLRSLPVMQMGRLVGMVTLADIRRVPREQWAQTSVAQVMIPMERLLTVSPRQPLQEALGTLVSHNVNQVLVIQNGQVVGLLTRENIMRLLDVRRGLAPTGGQPPVEQSESSRAPNPPLSA